LHRHGCIFSSRPGSPPIVAILPTLEVIISVRPGDDPEPCNVLWEAMTRGQSRPLPYVADDRHGIGGPRPSTAQEHQAIAMAFEAACLGPQQRQRINWSGLQFQDTAHVDEIPVRTNACSVGALRSLEESRGISLRATYPFAHPWAESVVLAKRIATHWPDLFSWISIGYRFVSVSMHSARFEAATEVIRNRSMRFLTVDVGDPFGFHGSVWQYQIRTPLWTMILSSRILQRLGGDTLVRTQCHGPLQCEAVGEGLLIRSGDSPMLGDVNRREDILAYQKVDRLLKPVRADRGVLILPPWDEGTSARWLQRFQQPLLK